MCTRDGQIGPNSPNHSRNYGNKQVGSMLPTFCGRPRILFFASTHLNDVGAIKASRINRETILFLWAACCLLFKVGSMLPTFCGRPRILFFASTPLNRETILRFSENLMCSVWREYGELLVNLSAACCPLISFFESRMWEQSKLA